MINVAMPAVHVYSHYEISKFILLIISSSVKRQKSESQNVDNKVRQIFGKNEHFLLPCAYQGVRNVRSSENLTCFDLLSPF